MCRARDYLVKAEVRRETLLLRSTCTSRNKNNRRGYNEKGIY